MKHYHRVRFDRRDVLQFIGIALVAAAWLCLWFIFP